MNGLMLTREIRASKDLCAMPLLILTSDRDPEEAAAAGKMGVGSFLVKPVRQAALLKAIAQAFGEVHAAAEIGACTGRSAQAAWARCWWRRIMPRIRKSS